MLDKVIKDKKIITGICDDLKTLYIKEYFQNTNKNILIVASNYYQANKVYQKVLSNISDTYFFPVDDFSFLNAEAISQELEIMRSTTLNKTLNKNPKIYVTDLKGYLAKMGDPKKYKKMPITIKEKENHKINDIVNKLDEMGYSKENIVNKIGEFSQRGFVIDVFPINSDPVRIEFWGDEVVEIKNFDIETQRSYKNIKSIQISLIKESVEKAKEHSLSDYIDDFTIVFDEITKIKQEYSELIKEPSFKDNYFPLLEQKESIIFDNINDQVESSNVLNLNSKKIFNLEDNYETFLNKLSKSNKTIVLCFKNTISLKRFANNVKNIDFVVSKYDRIVLNKVNIIVLKIEDSFEYNNFVFVSEDTLFNKKRDNYISKSKYKMSNRVKDLTKLTLGDYVVHEKYGIGVYKGLKTITKAKMKKDFIQIDYRGTDKLYIPVEKVDLISKFSSKDGYVPKINKLGSLEWEKSKLVARTKAKEMAIDLLNLYAQRENSRGFAFPQDTEEQLIFENEFSYQETKDQLRAIEEVKSDMERIRPMDRIICGDVGFGKTEVAFRAMFKSVMASKQVMFLCPTTILSRQHYLNAIERFKTFPVNIALLNRFVSKKNQEMIIKDFALGKIDILIGTHRILSNDIVSYNLGLLVIDEEQRFGVLHKEKIKTFKKNVDVLTLSATPIPRTVQMSLSGIKNLSLIETPPTNRIPIQTYVLEEQDQIIKTAIYKEISRDGQVFVLSNQIKGIEKKASEIEKLVPEAKVCYAHGKMSKNELEEVMLKFTNKEFDVLISTTIIETGIDIPSANTLIILDADRFGLSQLYQIRGRVGRSNKMAYCFLMYQKGKIISDVAVKRLKAIKEFTELGSGFAIAMRDLSIRGAGDILGSEQAGFVDTIGVELFIKMLNQEVLRLQGKEFDFEENDKPLVDVETSISNKYVNDEELKIEIHKKINSISSYEKLIEVKDELRDRFGKIDQDLEIYMYQEWFEKYANKLGIRDIRQNNREINITLSKEQTANVDGEKIFMDIVSNNRNVRFGMSVKRLVITINLISQEKHFIYTLIDIMKSIEKALVSKKH